MDAYARPEVWLPAAALTIALMVCLLVIANLAAWRMKLEEERRRAPGVIYFGVQAALTAALSAHGPDSLNAARRLISAIRAYLGPVLDLTDGAKSSLDALEKALTGKVKEATPDPAARGPRVILVPAGATGASAEVVSTGNVSVATATVEGAGGYHLVVTPPPPAGAKPVGEEKPKERDATTEEHVQAVRKAMSEFAAYWERDAIEQKLRKAQEALLIDKVIQPEDVRVEDVFPIGSGLNAPRKSGGFIFWRW
jgi:hypothetical protein